MRSCEISCPKMSRLLIGNPALVFCRFSLPWYGFMCAFKRRSWLFLCLDRELPAVYFVAARYSVMPNALESPSPLDRTLWLSRPTLLGWEGLCDNCDPGVTSRLFPFVTVLW